MEKREKKPLDLDTPLLSIQDISKLIEIDMKEWESILMLLCLFAKERIRLNKSSDSKLSPHLVGLVTRFSEMLSGKDSDTILKIFDKIDSNIVSFLKEQDRVFISTADAVDEMIENEAIPARLVKAMLGGKWPKHPFNFGGLGSFMIKEDGTLVPAAGGGEPAPGPDFKLKFEMVNDPCAKR